LAFGTLPVLLLAVEMVVGAAVYVVVGPEGFGADRALLIRGANARAAAGALTLSFSVGAEALEVPLVGRGEELSREGVTEGECFEGPASALSVTIGPAANLIPPYSDIVRWTCGQGREKETRSNE
jgi:hypothetical protein